MPRTRRDLFGHNLEISYRQTDEGKEKIKEIQNFIDIGNNLFGYEFDYDIMKDLIKPKEPIPNLLLLDLISEIDREGLISEEDITNCLDAEDIEILVEEGFIELDSTNGLFKLLYNMIGNLNKREHGPGGNRKGPAGTLYELMKCYYNDDDFRGQLLREYRSIDESIEIVSPELILEIALSYDNKIQNLG